MAEKYDVARPYKRIGVIGAGAWGTALALIAARAGRAVTLWARESEVVVSIARTQQNAPFLPGIALPPSITIADHQQELEDFAGQGQSRIFLILHQVQERAPATRQPRQSALA